MYLSTPFWSRTSSATIVQPLHSERIARKYCAARAGLFHVGCEAWLTSFHAPHVFTPSGLKCLTSAPTYLRYSLSEGRCACLRCTRSFDEMCMRTCTPCVRASFT